MIGTQIANYRIEEKLGEGGMGVVYKAVDINLERTVALKFLSSELNRDLGLIERFQAEAKAQANLNHTNIATLYNFINVDGNWLIAMEYVDGVNLEQTIMRNGVMQCQDAIPLFKQALLGIGFAHRFGVIHRDIKPANIMINRHGIVKVMDFGIAKVLSGRRLTRTGVAVGTVAYMSPEQIRNQGVDIRSDIYSLGVTLYQMLTAHVPFESESDFQVQYDHVNTPPPPLSLYYPYVPPGIEAAVLKSMEKDPAARFRTVEEFGAALERLDAVAPRVSATDSAQLTPVKAGEQRASAPVARASTTPAPPPVQVPGKEGTAERPDNQVSRQVGPGLLTPKNLKIAAAACLVLVTIAGLAIWKKSSSHDTGSDARRASGSLSAGGTSPSVAQSPSQPGQPASSNQPQATLALPTVPNKPSVTQQKPTEETVTQPQPQQQPKALRQPKQQPPPDLGAAALDKARTMYAVQKLLQPPGDCAVYWAQQATAHGNSGGPEMERLLQDQLHTQFEAALQTQNYDQAMYLLTAMSRFYPGQFVSWRSELQTAELNQRKVAENQQRLAASPSPAPSAVQTSARSFQVRHRHVNKLGFFVKTTPGEATEWYSNGNLTVSPSGSINYHCLSAPSPKVCEADIVLTEGDIKNLKVNSEGMLHLATTQGNYDFMADGNTIAEIRNELVVAKHKE
jgi:serine/threonine-protein kinase